MRAVTHALPPSPQVHAFTMLNNFRPFATRSSQRAWSAAVKKRDRCFSSTTDDISKKQTIPSNVRANLIFGANTDVGKSVISAGLVQASLEDPSLQSVHYVKPLQCGGSDTSFVSKHARESKNLLHLETLFRWETPASPHVVSRKENLPVSDDDIHESLTSYFDKISEGPQMVWIETAGGVLSPSSSSPGNKSPRHAMDSEQWGWLTQADLYQSLLSSVPVTLVGDGRLGGISATLSSLESLMIRGYNVVGIILIDSGYDNVSAIREYLSRDVNGFSIDPEKAIISLPKLPPESQPLHGWYKSRSVSGSLQGYYDHVVCGR